jgi:uncharacterized protein (DUF2384 family)
MTTVDGASSEFGNYSDAALSTFIRRAEIDLRLSRNDSDRHRRIAALLDAALAEHARRLNSTFANLA